jgi:hypothetical protein
LEKVSWVSSTIFIPNGVEVRTNAGLCPSKLSEIRTTSMRPRETFGPTALRTNVTANSEPSKRGFRVSRCVQMYSAAAMSATARSIPNAKAWTC